ncbi:alcohol dehydrogenase family protein [Gracilimonas sp.]|uniref:alcohol dehydrogenase family protein n=1 Tax=Gracilimonas sp. TaxID=1974203 RepID=UPI002871DE2F|nr:alcohol dehydrogenase family protein [Gracilimonas sp.]
MKAITFEGIRKIKIAEVPEPRIQDSRDVIIRVERGALCGSDMHVYNGRETGIDEGTVMGHEFTGTVMETGKEVSNFKQGDRVASPFTLNCGDCFYCKKGLSARCEKSRLFGWVENGIGLQGVHTKYVRVPFGDSTLVKLPDEISWETGVLMGDNFPTGYFCAEMAEIKPDQTYIVIGVIGCGPIGLMTIISTFLQGAENVFAVDLLQNRLKKAKQLGAIPINTNDKSWKEVVNEYTEGRGFDGVMEAVGSAATMKLAFDMVRPGGILASVGVQAYEQLPFNPPGLYDKNITMKFGRCPARSYMEKLIPLVQKEQLDLTTVITHTFSLEEGVEAYRLFDEQKDECIKVLLKP